MNVLLILIPVSIVLGGLGLCGFLWTLRSGQYDDAQGSAARLLLDDDEPDKD
jgi:cbb3-type cytochrome oxidase maturation protein